MDRGLYSAGSGMLLQQGVVDVSSANLANINTAGYRRSVPVGRGFDMVFQALVERSPGHTYTAVPGGGATLDGTYEDISQGRIKPTNNPFDAALEGNGYFVVQTPLGERYTRAGNFSLNAQGVLVTTDGYPVLSQGGLIEVEGEQLKFSSDGGVIVDDERIAQLRLVEFPDDQALVRVGENLYHAPGALADSAVDATEVVVRGAALELPNTTVVEEIVQVILAQRSFDLAARTVAAVDRTLGVAVQEIPRRV